MTTIDDLQFDPQNARRRTERSADLLEQSLEELGFARSIVIDENGVILAGNGTVAAARELDMTSVQIVDTDGETLIAVRRSGLTESQKKRLALLDNRTAELAEWDTAVLAELLESDPSMNDGMFDDAELLHIMDSLTIPDVMPQAEPEIESAVLIQIRCSQADLSAIRATLYEWMKRDGFTIDIS